MKELVITRIERSCSSAVLLLRIAISVGAGGGRGAPAFPSGAEIRFIQGIFPRTIGKLGNFSYCSPDLLTHSGRNFTAPLKLKSPTPMCIADKLMNNVKINWFQDNIYNECIKIYNYINKHKDH